MNTKIKKKPATISVRKKEIMRRRERAVELYQKGLSCNKIALKLHVNAHVVVCDLRAMGKHIKVQKTKAKRNAALIQDRCTGKTISTLSKKYKISEDRVKELIDNYNKTAKVPVPDYLQLRAIRLGQQNSKLKLGKSQSKLEISKSRIEKPLSKTGTSKSKVKKPQSKLGISKSKYGKSTRKLNAAAVPATEVRLNRIAAMRKSGTTVKAIAEKFKLSENRVYQLLKQSIPAQKKGISKKGKK
ncbi:MAG: hypothetical protein LBU34_09730 [Planctomycetaceae bacterium]|jgi:Mor family transcriptional regulator|nr:hypothetical protein [Planctomycetaceae bacterium]